MKLLLLSEIFPPQVGGSGRWFWDLYSRLDANSTIFAVGDDPEAQNFDQTHSHRCYRLTFDLPSWGVFTFSGLRAHWALFLKLRTLIKQENITAIHCGRGLPEGLHGWFASKWFGIPYLCYVHGEEIPIYFSSRECRWLSRVVYRNASRIIVNSQNTKTVFEQYYASTDRVCVLHPGVDATYFVPAEQDPEVRRQLGWGDRKVVLTVGRLQERKGHDYTILAMAEVRRHIPDVLYSIIGSGGEIDKLQALVASEGLEDTVQFLGGVDDALMLRCYQQCDLFVLANREVNGDFEGFGIVLVEAQACGKPVIAGDSGGTSETMIPGETGLVVDATRPDNIARAVVDILGDPDKQFEMGRKGREWVSGNLDWSVLIQQAEALFSELGQTITVAFNKGQ